MYVNHTGGLLKKITDFDSQEFLLNTPTAAFDLQDGNSKDHVAEDLITKITAVSPDNEGMDLWLSAFINECCEVDSSRASYTKSIAPIVRERESTREVQRIFMLHLRMRDLKERKTRQVSWCVEFA